MEKQTESNMLTAQEAANYLGVSMRVLKRKINTGEWGIPRVEFGENYHRYCKDDLDAFIQQHRKTKTA